jgi:hypothetical protein
MNVNLEDGELLATLHVADALDLVAGAANYSRCDDRLQRASSSDIDDADTRYAYFGAPRGIVGHALSIANVGVADLESMRDQSLRQLYRDGRLPIPITLGALIVLDAAQRSQDRGRQPDEVLDDATAAAARFLDLVSVLPVVWPSPVGAGPARAAAGCDSADVRPHFISRPRWEACSPKESSCRFTRAI